MPQIRVTTAFLKHNDRILILKRSNRVRTMKGMWSAVSGGLADREEPIERARIEIREETGIQPREISLINSTNPLTVTSPHHTKVRWIIFPFLFRVRDPMIRLNWENSDYRWIKADELCLYNTVPSLEDVLLCLL